LSTVTVPTAAEQRDVIAETERLENLDFAPRCDFHRRYHGMDVTATHSFRCRSCSVVELRCLECVEYFAPEPHMPTECEHCHFVGCFHVVVRVTRLGSPQ
jgi:hypothetical protein